MVPSIARQSVIIKCNMGKSVLTGNYEFYYAAGLIEKLSGVVIDEEIHPQELFTFLEEQLGNITAKDDKEAYLIQMMKDYRPGEEYDAQMKELLLWGKNETNLWQVTVSS